VLHYAQEIFEGLKAYRHADGSVWAFRPDANGERFARSARRLALPELAVDDFLASIELLVRTDQAWVPSRAETSLYLRPFMFASEAFLGVRPAAEVRYVLIGSPVGPYFSGGIRGVSIWLSGNYTRAAVGGTGAAKCGGNYAASLAAQVEASQHGCDQVCFLDAVERRWVEELGGMNLYFVHADGHIDPLVQEKEMLRLGDVVSRHGEIPVTAADQAVATVRRFNRTVTQRIGVLDDEEAIAQLARARTPETRARRSARAQMVQDKETPRR